MVLMLRLWHLKLFRKKLAEKLTFSFTPLQKRDIIDL